MTAHLIGLISPVLPVYDGRVPGPTDPPTGGQAAPTGPHAVVYGGTPTPTSLNLNHEHARTHRVWQVVCVSNNPNGARVIADRIIRAVDSVQAPDRPHDRYTVTYASPPIEDRDDPTAWRWTTTVEVQLTTGR